jgi:hypothetical protein
MTEHDSRARSRNQADDLRPRAYEHVLRRRIAFECVRFRKQFDASDLTRKRANGPRSHADGCDCRRRRARAVDDLRRRAIGVGRKRRDANVLYCVLSRASAWHRCGLVLTYALARVLNACKSMRSRAKALNLPPADNRELKREGFGRRASSMKVGFMLPHVTTH